MKIYLAGQNGLHSIVRGALSDNIFSRGGVSGNLKPAWQKTKEPTPESFTQALKDENFWQGGSLGTGYTRLRR